MCDGVKQNREKFSRRRTLTFSVVQAIRLQVLGIEYYTMYTLYVLNTLYLTVEYPLYQ